MIYQLLSDVARNFFSLLFFGNLFCGFKGGYKFLTYRVFNRMEVTLRLETMNTGIKDSAPLISF